LTGFVKNESGAPVAGARITVRAPPASIWRTETAPEGALSFWLPGPGDYLVQVERDDYYELKERTIRVASSQEIALIINTVRKCSSRST
jgi:hypothetical protein